MNDQIIIALKSKLEDISASGNDDAETLRNGIKEELQYYVLNFIYHHSEYGKWVMYGGSALRICHGLDRMSVDLDFEIGHAVSDEFLDSLRSEVELHFLNTHGAGSDLLTIKTTKGRGLLLKFHVSKELGISHPSNQIHVKIDLNHFVAPKTVIDRKPVNRNQLSFVIRVHNMGTLMASKIAAIRLRGQRGVGEAIYEEKGRDIYDLLWYMSKKVVPDLNYLSAKGVDVKNLQALFDKLTLQMNKVSDANLKQDLTPMFFNRTYIENWLTNWRESYLRLLDEYRIRTVTHLQEIIIHRNFMPDVWSFIYVYSTTERSTVRIIYALSDYWIDFDDGELPDEADAKLSKLIQFSANGVSSGPRPEEKLRQYATLFFQKTEKYLKKTGRILLGDMIATKLIRMTAQNLNQKEQILLNKSALLNCELDDLLR